MDMNINSVVLQSLLAILAGLLIFARPAVLSYVVAIYLTIFGAIGLINHYGV